MTADTQAWTAKLKKAVSEANRGTLKQRVARHKKRLKAKYAKPKARGESP